MGVSVCLLFKNDSRIKNGKRSRVEDNKGRSSNEEENREKMMNRKGIRNTEKKRKRRGFGIGSKNKEYMVQTGSYRIVTGR